LPSGDATGAVKKALADRARAPTPRSPPRNGAHGARRRHARELRAGLDVVIVMLHGPYGEDGPIQGLLELADVPYVGAGVLASAVGMDKATMKAVFSAHGLPIVEYTVVLRRRVARAARRRHAPGGRGHGLPLLREAVESRLQRRHQPRHGGGRAARCPGEAARHDPRSSSSARCASRARSK